MPNKYFKKFVSTRKKGNLNISSTSETVDSLQGKMNIPDYSKFELNSSNFSSPTVQFDGKENNYEKNDVNDEVVSRNYSEGNGSRIELKKNITLFNGVSIIVGSIIGSGIFISPMVVTKYSGGNIGISLVLWLIAGIISIIGALCYAELGTTIARSGGEYAYLNEVMGPLPAFLFLWVNLLVSRPVVTAIICWAFGYYIATVFFCVPDSNVINPIAKYIAAFGLILLSYINCLSVKTAMKLQNIFTIGKLIAVAFIIITGVWKLVETRGEAFQNIFMGDFKISQFPTALFSGLFSYAGWNNLNYVIEELQNPNKNLPLSIIIGLPLVTVVYILINVAYFAVLTPIQIESSVAVAFDFMNTLFPRVSWIMPIFVSLSALGSVNGILFTSGRIVYTGARFNQLPKIFAMIHISRCTPVPSIILLTLISLLFLASKDITILISYFNFTLFLFVGMCIGCVIYLRWKRPEMPRPIKFNICLHIVFFVICVFFVVIPIFNNPLDMLIGSAIIVSGIPVYYLAFKTKFRNKTFEDITRKFEEAFQKLFLVVSPDKDL